MTKLAQQGVQLIRAVQLADARRCALDPAVHADHRHAQLCQVLRGLGPDPADAQDQRRGLGKIHRPGVQWLGPILVAHLAWEVVVKPARERQYERKDVRRDMLVEDAAKVGGCTGVLHQLPEVVACRRRDGRRSQPPELLRPRQQLLVERPEQGVGVRDLPERFISVLGHHDGCLWDSLPNGLSPLARLLALRWQKNHLECG
jgi:hypothetical protein